MQNRHKILLILTNAIKENLPVAHLLGKSVADDFIIRESSLRYNPNGRQCGIGVRTGDTRIPYADRDGISNETRNITTEYVVSVYGLEQRYTEVVVSAVLEIVHSAKTPENTLFRVIRIADAEDGNGIDIWVEFIEGFDK